MILLFSAMLGLIIFDGTQLIKNALKKELILYIILFVCAVGLACLCTMLTRKSSLYSLVLEMMNPQ